MDLLQSISGITGVIIIFGLFLLITGLLVGGILVSLKKSKSQKVDDLPAGQTNNRLAEQQKKQAATEHEQREDER